MVPTPMPNSFAPVAGLSNHMASQTSYDSRNRNTTAAYMA